MKKGLLILIAVGLIGAYVPDVRTRVAPAVDPVLVAGASVVRTGVTWMTDSIFRWAVRRQLELLSDRLNERAVTGEPLPDPRRFAEFVRLEQLGSSIDPWGNPYYLELQADIMVLGSSGPDRDRGTDDDVRVSTERN